jgi:ElaB/YqjD/DUF883 family membrane-anchored ribosome-binding protein
VVRALLGRCVEMSEAREATVGADVVPAIVKKVQRADERVMAFVEERPIAAMAVALGLGYLIGRVFSRIA